MSLNVDSRPLQGGFQDFALRADIQRGIAGAGFTEPRSIQVQTIPAALEGRDVLGLAQTGTGKTAAFVLPILEQLLQNRRPGPSALVLAPTRELAMQIHAEFQLLAKFTPLKAVTVFGGVQAQAQIRALRDRPDVIIACPGRLLDLMERRAVMLATIRVLVLDEADHMFDLGFLPSIRRILAALPHRRQNLLFSATMPAEIRKLANALLVRPHVVELAPSRPPSTIEHALYSVSQDQKVGLLEHLLSADDFTSAIVFSRTKHRAKRLADQLSRSGHAAVALQGNMTQVQRDRAMEGFRSGRYAVLVATDIAARGIDVAHISHVVNFDMPSTPDAYTHRIGRTGRAERKGRAFTFVCREDHEAVRALERKLGAPIPRGAVPTKLADLRLPPGARGAAATKPSEHRPAARPAWSNKERSGRRRRSSARSAY
jgi:ATP-dependent RNA helicase RhlE